MENAVSQKDFEKAQFYREQEVSARENLQFIRERFDVKSSTRKVVVSKADIDEVVSKWTGVPMTSINQDEGDKLLRMEADLHRRVVSQEAAISAISRAIRRSRAGLKNPNRPVGSFIFLGPTGVGKTELCKALAEFLFDSQEHMIRVDMSEFMEKHSVAKLIGSPPGYIGHDEGGQLTEAVRRKPYSVLLLDELDYGDPRKINCLQSVLEHGRVFLKKMNRYVVGAAGFTVVATGNTKGQGGEETHKHLLSIFVIPIKVSDAGVTGLLSVWAVTT